MAEFDKNALLAAVEHIPALPQLISSINAIRDSEESAGFELQSLLEPNEDLNAKVLKVVNTIYYAYPDPIGGLARLSPARLSLTLLTCDCHRLYRLLPPAGKDQVRPVHF